MIKQHHVMNQKSLKERALRKNVNKVFKDEIAHEDAFQEEALR